MSSTFSFEHGHLLFHLIIETPFVFPPLFLLDTETKIYIFITHFRLLTQREALTQKLVGFCFSSLKCIYFTYNPTTLKIVV